MSVGSANKIKKPTLGWTPWDCHRRGYEVSRPPFHAFAGNRALALGVGIKQVARRSTPSKMTWASHERGEHRQDKETHAGVDALGLSQAWE